MPPKPKASSPNVARLTPDEQIGYLFHQYEGFADWRLLVDERLEKGEEQAERLTLKVDNLDTKLGTLAGKMEERHSQLILIQQQVLIAVQGQQVKGMETPGMVDRMKSLEDRATRAEEREAAKDAKLLALEQFKFRAQLFFGGLIALSGFSAWKAIPYITQIAAVFGIGN